MSKGQDFHQFSNDTPPPYTPGQQPNVHPMNNLPQSDPHYGYDQQTGNIQSTTNVVHVQPGAVSAVPGTTTVIIQQQDVMPSMSGHLVLSCFVFWCCNPLFGMIAFFIAIAGMNASTPPEGRSLGKASLWVSVSGIIVAVVIGAILIGLFLAGLMFAEKTAEDGLNDWVNDYQNQG